MVGRQLAKLRPSVLSREQTNHNLAKISPHKIETILKI